MKKKDKMTFQSFLLLKRKFMDINIGNIAHIIHNIYIY